MKFESESELFNYMEQHFYSAALSDIMDEMGIEHQAIDPAIGIKALSKDFVTAGRSFTFLNAPDTRKEDPYELAIAGVDQLRENSLAVVTAVESINTGIMGELTATAMRARKSRGVVVDGYTRDGRKLREKHSGAVFMGEDHGLFQTLGVRIRMSDNNICSNEPGSCRPQTPYCRDKIIRIDLSTCRLMP